MKLKFSYQAAESIMRKRAASFYAAFSDLERSKFLDIAAIYAFCRHADDLADNSKRTDASATLKALDDLEEQIHGIYEGEGSEELCRKYDWWKAFENAVKSRHIKIRPLLDQIDGQRSDVLFRKIETMEELTLYCRKVAGTVGLMLAPMLIGEKADENYENICESLGIAMQITNILRDIGEDIRCRQRVYIPYLLMEKYGVERMEIEKWSKYASPWQKFSNFLLGCSDIRLPQKIIDLWEELASISEQLYDEFYQNIFMFGEDVRIPVTAAAVYYRAILDEVRRNRYNCFTCRCATSYETKKLLMEEVLQRCGKKS